MADLYGINGNSELVFKLKLKTEINSGESLDKIADEKIREYFKQNVEKNSDGILEQSEMLSFRNAQVKEASNPAEWKTTTETVDGKVFTKKTKGAVTQTYDSSGRLLSVLTDKGGGVTNEIRYEYSGEGKDAIAKMVYVNGQPITNVSASDEQVEAPKEVKSEAGARVQTQTQSTEDVSSEDVSSQPQTATEVESPETSGKVVVSQKKELPPETGNRYMEKFDNGRLKTVIRNEDGSKTTTMQDEGGEPVEIKYNADGNIVTYAKNGESFKQTAARLGFTPGTPEYEAFVNANSSASKKGWFLVGAKVIVPKELESKVALNGLNVDSKGEIEAFNKGAIDGADISAFEGKTETKTMDKNTSWWNLAKEQLVAEGKQNPTNAEIADRMNVLMKLNPNKQPSKGTEIVVIKQGAIEDTDGTEKPDGKEKTKAPASTKQQNIDAAVNELAPDLEVKDKLDKDLQAKDAVIDKAKKEAVALAKDLKAELEAGWTSNSKARSLLAKITPENVAYVLAAYPDLADKIDNVLGFDEDEVYKYVIEPLKKRMQTLGISEVLFKDGSKVSDKSSLEGMKNWIKFESKEILDSDKATVDLAAADRAAYNKEYSEISGIDKTKKAVIADLNKSLAEAAYANPKLKVKVNDQNIEYVELPNGDTIWCHRDDSGKIESISIYTGKDSSEARLAYDKDEMVLKDLNDSWKAKLPPSRYNYDKVIELAEQIFGAKKSK